MRHLMWFRNDLRIGDNPALYQASLNADAVTALYIDCPGQWRRHNCADIQRDLVRRCVEALAQDLAKLGIPLRVITVDTFTEVSFRVQELVQEQGIDAVFCNNEVGVNEARRDRAVATRLDIPLHTFNGDCLIEPGALQTAHGEMFKVFTPFSRAWLSMLKTRGWGLCPTPVAQGAALSASAPDWSDATRTEQSTVNSSAWPAGERAALARLREFCAHHLLDYEKNRDLPALAATSSLSPYLAIGVLSPGQCLSAMEGQLGFVPLSRGEHGFAWLNELIWREFYRHLMVAHPHLSMHRAFKPETEALRWSRDEGDFQRWCDGQTGYPIVDAAMRCLNQTGWMHNRLRMICASFLCKDLHIDWRWGEGYFMSQLIDGDLAANNGGWQWSASTGADAAPYFRIFNPTRQSEKFDPQGDFLRRWLPELLDVPTRHIHQPRAWLDQYEPHNSYPPPIVDHQRAREYTLQLFRELRKTKRDDHHTNRNQTVLPL
ncbi:MAG TPA: deoxyribodipyrimidine photo-lyase [Gammaproteobacteria bacterium]|nr:deoxyribodipyrimidine photo-lyase [Gammaproteobacteria bacterium]